jgi:hypothetical protein
MKLFEERENSYRWQPVPGKESQELIKKLGEKMATANSKAMAKVIAKAWTDPAFKDRLYNDPANVLAAEGVKLPKGAKVYVHENSNSEVHVVLPQRPDAALAQDALNQRADAVSEHILYTCCR